MINLLPPARKANIRAAKLNSTLLGYAWGTAGVFVILCVVFGGTLYYQSVARTQAAADLAAAKAEIGRYDSFRKAATDTSERLVAIKTIQASQTRFSTLLGDLAKVLPQGASLDGITLTGDDKKPVQVSITALTYESAVAFRNAIALSPRIAAADIASVTKTERGYSMSVILAFKPGQAK